MRTVRVLITGVDRFDVWFHMLGCLGEMGDLQCSHVDVHANQRSVTLRTWRTNQMLEQAVNRYVPSNVPLAIEETMEECHDCQMAA